MGKIVRTSINQLREVADLVLNSAHLTVEVLDHVGLFAGFDLLGVVDVLKTGDLTPHLGALVLHDIDLVVELVQASSLIVKLVATDSRLLFEFVSLKNLGVVEVACALKVFLERLSGSALFTAEVFQLIESTSCVPDFGNLSVDQASGFVFSVGFLVAGDAVAILHIENLVVDAAVVSALVAQVVELPAKFSDELVFLGCADFDSGVGVVEVVGHVGR